MSDREPRGLEEWNEYHRLLRNIPTAIADEDLDTFNSLIAEIKYGKQQILSTALMNALGAYGSFKDKTVWKKMVLGILKLADLEKLEYMISWATQPGVYPADVSKALVEANMLVARSRNIGIKTGITQVSKSLDPDSTLHIAKMLGRSRRARRKSKNISNKSTRKH